MALVISGVVDRNAALATWRPQRDQEKVEHVFARQALSMTWDFAEAVPLSNSTGSFGDRAEGLSRTIHSVAGWPGSKGALTAQAQLADAAEHLLPDDSATIWFTDPPYYDAVPYSDLSDFFFVWLKRAMPEHPLLRDPFDPSNPLTPKRREAVQDDTKRDNGRWKDRAWFEEAMARAFAEGRRVLRGDGVASVVFAHKTTEGWEALLSGMIRGGWSITGSWPIVTEMGARLRARESAALATSIHLICRPRSEDAAVGDWGDILRELPKRVGIWMERLQTEGIHGADLLFACFGPALELFSRYSKVETADGREVVLVQYLENVWEVIGRTALQQVLGTDSPTDFGEDARLTALFLWTFRSINAADRTEGTGPNAPGGDDIRDQGGFDEQVEERRRGGNRGAKGYTLPYDIVRRIAQPLGIHLDRWDRRLIEIERGMVRLLPLAQRAKFVVEPGVAQDLEIVDTVGRFRSRPQLSLFDAPTESNSKSRADDARARLEQETWSQLHLDSITTLEHVHKAMLFQKQGQTSSLSQLLFYEKQHRPQFLRLSNALSALYPDGSEEKRLLDAMLLAMPK